MPLSIVTLIVAICFIESFTKGWASFALIPFSLIFLPLVRVLHGQAVKRAGSKLNMLRSIQISSLLVFYIFAVGFGDTNDVLLFGFYTVNDSSVIATASGILAATGGLAALITTILLLVKTVSINPKASKAIK